MPKLDTLVSDIYGVFDGVDIDPKVAEDFGVRLGKMISSRISERKETTLRLSNLSKPCLRQLWYSVNTPELGEKLSGSTRIKFLVGDIYEEVILFLAQIAGHKVTRQQETVEVNGVVGHIDGFIDDELVDVKSASPYSFDKFKNGLRPEDDSFGYLGQLGSYGVGTGVKRGHFLVANKVLGTLHVDSHNLPEIDYGKRADEVREALAGNEPPARGFTDEPEGKSGNRKLCVNCSYCSFKEVCWPGLKVASYSRGPVYLTKVVRQPKVDVQ